MAQQGVEMAEEKRWLERVLAEIGQQTEEAGRTLEVRRAGNVNEREWMWETQTKRAGWDDDWTELMSEMRETTLRGEEARMALVQLQRLKRLSDNPYFGRFDFREDGTATADPIYIGIAGLAEHETGQLLVCDWRAPIASMFYDFEPGRASFTLNGLTTAGEMTLKRQYRIRGGRIAAMFDCAVRIGDDVLQEMLSRGTNRKMGTIVTTIQREQNRIIRDESKGALIVQGPAGSGKTSIALQRAAYLLYRFRGEIEARQIAVFSPSWLQNEYTSNVLPELGEESVTQSTFYDYAVGRIRLQLHAESPFEQMEALLSERSEPDRRFRTEAIKLKSSPGWGVVLSNYAAYLADTWAPWDDVRFEGDVVMTAQQITRLIREEYAFLPIASRLEKVRRRVSFLIEPALQEKRKLISDLLEQLTEDDRVAELREEMQQECERVDQQLNGWAVMNVLTAYQTLLGDDALFAQASSGIVLPGPTAEIRAQTIRNLQNGTLPYEDLPALLLLKNLLEGPPEESFRHAIIDEAQEYSWMHFHVLDHEFRGSGFTILGDRLQASSPGQVGDWSALADAFGQRGTEFAVLHRSYRSTREIGAFTDALLPAGAQVDHVDRPGKRPVVIQVPVGSMPEAAARGVAELKSQGAKSIAVLCKTAAAARSAAEQMRSWTDLQLVVDDGMRLEDKTVVMPVFLAKGLEFDAAIVYDAGRYDSGPDRALFYCACTRALHHLRLYCESEPKLLQGVDEGLYESASYVP